MARGYKVSGGGYFRFAGSQAEVREHKADLIDNKGVSKKDISVEELDIPTAKSELIPFLNETIIEVEDSYDTGAETGAGEEE